MIRWVMNVNVRLELNYSVVVSITVDKEKNSPFHKNKWWGTWIFLIFVICIAMLYNIKYVILSITIYIMKRYGKSTHFSMLQMTREHSMSQTFSTTTILREKILNFYLSKQQKTSIFLFLRLIRSRLQIAG